jgi:molybdate transport system regulatory protein
VTRYPGLTVRVPGKGNPAIGPGKAELVARIRDTGSISAAAREMGMSYRRAWMLVAALNASFREPVIVAETGGRRGGGARVTPFGEDVLAEYLAIEDKAASAIASDLESFRRHLKVGSSRE